MSEHQRDEHRYPLELPFGNRLGAIAVLALMAAGGAAALGADRLSERTDAAAIALVAVGGTVAIWALWVLFVGRRRSLIIGAEWIGIPSTITGRTARRIRLTDVADAERLHVAGPTGVAGPAVLHLRPSGPGSVGGERVELPVDRLALDDARRASSHLARVLASADVDTTPSVWDDDAHLDTRRDTGVETEAQPDRAAALPPPVETTRRPPTPSKRPNQHAGVTSLIVGGAVLLTFFLPFVVSAIGGNPGSLFSPVTLVAIVIIGQVVKRATRATKRRHREPAASHRESERPRLPPPTLPPNEH